MIFSYDDSILSTLPARPARSNKGTFGRVLVAGGSVGMSGAAYFSAKAAYRSGAGLVGILAPERNRVIYQTQLPEATLFLYDEATPDERVVRDAVRSATVVVLGVGLGKSDAARRLMYSLLESLRVPVIIDADGLNLIALDSGLWELVPKNAVFTPHPAEMSRLTGASVAEICSDIPSAAARFAADHGVVCVMKDANTAVSDGSRTAINRSGNSGMATGGSGDVLSGVIAGLVAQGMPPFEAAALGVYIHGRAGDFAAARLSEYSVTASDLIDSLPQVFGLKRQ